MVTEENQQAQASNVPMIVVGIGASAGGLEALQSFFKESKPLPGMAFVVVQHLSPDFPSLMDEILSRGSTMPVYMVDREMELKSGTIYVNAPGKELIVAPGRLVLTDRERSSALSMPIDRFFRSLAGSYGSRAIAVVLSGTGSDGSRGIRSVHDAGGLVVVQSIESAKFDGMPRTALASGVVDLILPPEDIFNAAVRHKEALDNPIGPELEDDVVELVQDNESVLFSIYKLLFESSGIDFSMYKLSTVARRVNRRLALVKAHSLEAYQKLLEENADELGQLYKDLLIGVTSFFRDKEAFAFLEEQVIPPLLAGLEPDQELRIWDCGCATGEEPYSIAILLREQILRTGLKNRVRIFASDVHQQSLSVAMAGVYPAEGLKGVSEERVRANFIEQGNSYRVSPEIRSMVTFVAHNVLRDPPFTKIDLISCRNFLIYLQPHAQVRVLSIFHYALRHGGILFLGSSETPGSLRDDFESLENSSKIFRKSRDRSVLPALRPVDVPAFRMRPPEKHVAGPFPDNRLLSILDAVVSECMPAGFVINEIRELLYCFGRGADLLTMKPGKMSIDILELVPQSLRMLLIGGIPQVRKEGKPLRFERVNIPVPGDELSEFAVTLRLVTIKSIKTAAVLILLEPAAAGTQKRDVEVTTVFSPSDLSRYTEIEGLHEELRFTKDTLQATIEELETTNEELQASNEELVASNEELQSTNEELHSLNEELYTVNTEYHQKINELTELSNDMENFLGATDIATIFLDSDLNIRRYTPKVAELLLLMPQDIGRRIDTFALRLRTPDLLEHIQSVLRSGLPMEAESQAFSGRYFLVRVIPYRTTDTIEGVVVSMIDITSLKQKEQDLRLSEERYRTLVQASEGVIWNMDSAGSIIAPQVVWEKQTAQRWEEYRGLGWMNAVLEQDRARVLQLFGTGYAEGEVRSTLALVWNAEHQESRVCSIRVVALKDDSSNTKEWIGVLTDAHELHRSRALLGETDVLRNILDASPALICVQDVLGRYILVNREFEGVVGKPASEIEGKGDYEIFPLAVAERLRAHHLEVIHSESVREHEEILRVGDSDRIFLAARCPVRSAEKGLYGVALIATDITERKAGEKEALEGIRLRDTFLATISHEIRNPLHAILSAASLFRDEGEKPEVRQKAAGVVVRQAQQMARLVEDLLDLSRSRQGKIRVYRKQLDLRSVVEPVLEQIRTEYDDREQQLTVVLPPEPVYVNGDGERLRQMLVNLLDNASKYSPPGSVVELRLIAEAQQARIEVRDSGQGIAKEQIPKIFDQFMQVDPKAVPRSQGMGLGLWVVNQIVREHRGSVGVESLGIGKGSVFTVVLPTLDDQRDLAATHAETARIHSGGERVLLVEDNKDSREMLQFILQSEGFSVDVAKDGHAAIEIFAHREPNAALVDIGLPDMSGLELARLVREKDPDHHITLIAISGYGSDEDKQTASQAGFDAYLTKPVQIGDVVALLRAELTGVSV